VSARCGGASSSSQVAACSTPTRRLLSWAGSTLHSPAGSRRPATRYSALVSAENVEIVQAAINAANREDWDATFRGMAPDFELDMSRAVGPWRGVFNLDQLRRFLEEFAESWESVRVEPHEFFEAGDLVAVPWTMHLRGREGSRRCLVPPSSGRSATEQSSAFPCTRSGRTPSKPCGCGNSSGLLLLRSRRRGGLSSGSARRDCSFPMQGGVSGCSTADRKHPALNAQLKRR
jgi:SnoaL-like protein